MKRILSCVALVLCCLIVMTSLSACIDEAIGSIVFLSMMAACASEELIETSESPDGTYTLEAYLTNGGASTDFGIKVYQRTDNGSELVYYHYHRSEVTIEWQSDSVVVINGTPLDLSKGETYESYTR